MAIGKSGKTGYNGMDWVDALTAQKKPRDYMTRQASVSESETVENVIQETMEAVFGTPTNEETSLQAVERTSREIAAKAKDDMVMQRVAEIKAKLSDRDEPIDPVEVGVMVKDFSSGTMVPRKITREEWDNATDPKWVNQVACAAVEAFMEKKASEWQERAMKPTSRDYTMESGLPGRVMPSPAEDDSTGRRSRVPVNANSILDPDRIDRLASEILTEKDKERAARVESNLERAAKSSKHRQEANDEMAENAPETMNGGKVVPSASGKETSAFVHRVPKNQLSITDDLNFEDMSHEQRVDKLAKLFADRIEDNGESIKEANEDRRKSIQGDREQDRSWEKLDKPTSTQDLTRRLMDLWIDPAQE